MTTPSNNGNQPAYPEPGYTNEHGTVFETTPGMSLRQYACIHLRVPTTGEPWLDDIIKQARRDWFAGKALASFIKVDTAYDYTTGHCDSGLVSRAYTVANAMIADAERKCDE